jgi:uncharacterized protein (TIGR04255 family)
MPEVIAPLAFVAAEVRASYTPALVADATVAALSSVLVALPVPKREQRHSLIIGSAPVGPAEVAVRLMSRDAMTSLTITATSLTLETTSYQGVEAFSGLFAECMRAIAGVVAPSAVERVGLRYVNELRVAEPIANIEQWRHYVCPEVLGAAVSAGAALKAAGVPGATASALQTVVAFELPGQRAITGRFGPLSGPPAIGSNPLRRPEVPADGPYFVVDLDAYWPSGPATGEPFDPDALLSTVTALHVPIEAAFLWATTDKFRKEAL